MASARLPQHHGVAAAHLRVAFGSVPKDGGTYTFYRNIRPALADLGVDIRCVTVGQQQADLVDQRFWDSGCVLLAEDETDLKRQAMEFARWCEDEKVDIVIGVNSHPILAAIPHLPDRFRAVARCANAFDEGYELTLVGLERLMRIVALVPRLRDDLVNNYGVDTDRIKLIPNGISSCGFKDAAQRTRGLGERLELGFVGRLEHRQKGVMHIPPILARLARQNVSFRLRIVGQGRHEGRLRDELAEYVSTGEVEFLGSRSASEVADLLGDTDVFLFPSHFEGCPNALLEAMMAGTVPASWRLQGITDFIIEDGHSGVLAPVGDCEGLALAIADLSANRERLRAMSLNASTTAMQRFRNEECAQRYHDLFLQVLREPAPSVPPEPWSRFRPARVLAPTLICRIKAFALRRLRRGGLDHVVRTPALAGLSRSQRQRSR